MKHDDGREKARLNITVDKDLAIRLQEMAEEDGRSLSNYINHVLRDLIIRKIDPFQ